MNFLPAPPASATEMGMPNMNFGSLPHEGAAAVCMTSAAIMPKGIREGVRASLMGTQDL